MGKPTAHVKGRSYNIGSRLSLSQVRCGGVVGWWGGGGGAQGHATN